MDFNWFLRWVLWPMGLLFLQFLRLKDEAKTWLKVMGSSQIDKVSFRDSYLLIGQRGLKQGQAVEFVSYHSKTF